MVPSLDVFRIEITNVNMIKTPVCSYNFILFWFPNLLNH